MHHTSKNLVTRIEQLTARERRHQAEWFACMVEIDRKGVAVELGYSSLFYFLVQGLKYSEGSAGKRLQVIKACQLFPFFIELIANNKMSLSGISLLSRHLKENYAEAMIEKAIGLSMRDIEKLIVTFAPKPIPREIGRQLFEPAPGPELFPTDAAATPKTEAPKNTIKPLSTAITRYGFNGSKSFDEKLQRVRDALKHKHPAGKLEDVLEAALDALLAQQSKKLTPTKRKTPPPKKHTRYVPVALKREVWKQGEGRCTFVAENGKRCAEKGGLEIDHAQAWAQGGSSWDLTNLRLRCRAHNQLVARQQFGVKVLPGKQSIAPAETGAAPLIHQSRIV